MRTLARTGFTLIELSIVVVLVGLLLGSLLAGQDLIRAAKVRMQVAQIESLTSAVNAFKLKTNQLPGDISPDGAAAFGLEPRDGTVGSGDGNGAIQQLDEVGQYLLCGEAILFVDDLAKSGLLGTISVLADGECVLDTGNGYENPYNMATDAAASNPTCGLFIKPPGF